MRRNWKVISNFACLREGNDRSCNVGAGVDLAWAVAVPLAIGWVEDNRWRDREPWSFDAKNNFLVRTRLASNAIGAR
jgi:hypothetical protein